VTRRGFGLAAAVGLLVALPGCVASPPAPTAPPSLPSDKRVLAADSARQQAREVTVRVRNRGCSFLATGSGFAVSAHRLVTNRHVVEGAEQLQLDSWDGRSISVAVHRVAYLHDLALIETVEALPRVARLAGGDPEPGAEVSAVGFPLGGPLAQTRGSVVDLVPGAHLGETGRVLRITAAVRHGNSGGPLLDDAGRVVGVVYASETRTGYGLAIPVSSLRTLLGDGDLLTRSQVCGSAATGS
jgi:S1-C subfamily serine protease